MVPIDMDLSVQIVHYNTPKLLEETLSHIRGAAPKLDYEVIVVDNNPNKRLSKNIEVRFPEVRFLTAEQHLGFGGGQNLAYKTSRGRYVLVFNPDIFVDYGDFEALVAYMDAYPDVGIVGAQLRNPNGTLQDSCYRFDQIFVKLLRRTPLRSLPFVKDMIHHHLMHDDPRNTVMDVDWLMGACLCVRREVFEQLGGFDEGFVLYFEDTDFCRRVWEAGFRVVYNPEVSMVHYHRREGSHGSLLFQLFQRANRLHLASWLRYTKKYFRSPNPRRR